MGEIMEDGNVVVSDKEIVVPPEARDLLTACSDLSAAASETNTKYSVVGSVANVCAVGDFYRMPGDVDSWYDVANADAFRDALNERGYSRSVVDAEGSPFPIPLERFEKGESIIEVRGANYTERGIEYPIRIPIPGVPVDKRPIGQLVCPPSFAEPQQSNLGGTTIMTTKKEALWIGLNSTLPLIQVIGEKEDKRLLDLEKLSDGLDEALVEEMLAEEPGLYLGSKPIVTTSKQGLLKLLLLGAKVRKKVT